MPETNLKQQRSHHRRSRIRGFQKDSNNRRQMSNLNARSESIRCVTIATSDNRGKARLYRHAEYVMIDDGFSDLHDDGARQRKRPRVRARPPLSTSEAQAAPARASTRSRLSKPFRDLRTRACFRLQTPQRRGTIGNVLLAGRY